MSETDIVELVSEVVGMDFVAESWGGQGEVLLVYIRELAG